MAGMVVAGMVVAIAEATTAAVGVGVDLLPGRSSADCSLRRTIMEDTPATTTDTPATTIMATMAIATIVMFTTVIITTVIITTVIIIIDNMTQCVVCVLGSAQLAQEAEECTRSLIKTPNLISERPPRGGLSYALWFDARKYNRIH
jgi:hypothetical protein